MRGLLAVSADRAFSVPTGTVTFLLTDIEGSTARWETDPAAMGPAVSRHYALLDEAVARHGGVRPEEQGEGDSIVAAFSRASDALAAALDAQRELTAELGHVFGVRMAIHTGEAQLRDEQNYFGQSVIRCARLRALGHGGQILVSRSSAELAADGLPAGVALRDLGEVRLRDLGRREHVFQLEHPDLPGQFGPLRSLDVVAANIPAPLTTLIGREQELAALADLVADHRLVTLTGVGGAGKTRLAMQLGADLVDRFDDGVWWVELAPIADGAEVTTAVLRACGLHQAAGAAPLDLLLSRLRDRRTLVVLDNCEHVLAESAALADALLRGCPQVSIVATSREHLGVPGEAVWRAPSLALPPPGPPPPPERLGTFDAVRLFVERARLVRPHFEVTTANAPAVAEICARLDGIPLALELAAARVRQLPVERIAAGIDDRFRLLTGGARTVMARQQTLEASIEWSHELLDATERDVFCCLGVFVDGFTPEAAEFVATATIDGLDGYDVYDALVRLTDKSLVTVDDGGRYRLLESIRSFSLGRARERQLTDTIRQSHLDWALDCTERWGMHRVFTLERADAEVRAELANLAAALAWSTRPGGTLARPLLRPIARGWYEVASFQEAASWAARLLDGTAGSPVDQAYVAAEMANVAAFGGYAPIVERALAAEALAIETGDLYLQSRACRVRGLSTAGALAGELATVRAMEAGRDAARGIGDSMGEFECTLQIAAAHVSAGRLDDLQRELAHAESLVTWRHPLTTLLRAARAGYFFWSDQAAGALEIALAEPPGSFPAHAYLNYFGVQSALRLGDRDAAQEFAGRLRAHADVAVFALTSRLAEMIIAQALGSPNDQRAAAGALLAATPMGASSFGVVLNASAMVAAEGGHDDLAAMILDRCPDDDSTWPPTTRLMVQAARARVGPTSERWQCAHTALSIAQQAGLRATYRGLLALIADHHFSEGNPAIGAALTRSVVADVAAHGELVVMPELLARIRDGAEDHPSGEPPLTIDDAVTLALRSRGERRRPDHGWDSLTPTELEVCGAVADGLSNAQVAARLIMSANTVKTHLAHAFTKLGVANRTELAAEVLRRQRPG